MSKASIDERKSGTTVDTGVTQANGNGGILRYPVEFFGQTSAQFVHGFVHDVFFRTFVQKFQCGLVGHGDSFIQGQDDDTHGRYADEQVQEMVLFPQSETFFLQLVHHTVEDRHDAVGFPLSYG